MGVNFVNYLDFSNDEIHLEELKIQEAQRTVGKAIETKSEYEKRTPKVILIVDDEEINRIVLAEILDSLGFRSFTAGGGLEAIEIYTDHVSEIDAVILDFMMPEMNGKETFERLRRINPQAKIIISSGYSDREEIEIMRKIGLFAVMRKPFSIEYLESVLDNL